MRPQEIKKSKALGMSFSTADYRLKKLILFNLLAKNHENMCFRCGQRIETADELTVDHKHPWLDVDVALFWDMDNIAFSHSRCNSVFFRRNTPDGIKFNLSLRKIGDYGTAWCRGHQCFLPIKKFSKNSSRWNGLQGECQECRLRNPSRKVQQIGAGEQI